MAKFPLIESLSEITDEIKYKGEELLNKAWEQAFGTLRDGSSSDAEVKAQQLKSNPSKFAQVSKLLAFLFMAELADTPVLNGPNDVKPIRGIIPNPYTNPKAWTKATANPTTAAPSYVLQLADLDENGSAGELQLLPVTLNAESARRMGFANQEEQDLYFAFLSAASDLAEIKAAIDREAHLQSVEQAKKDKAAARQVRKVNRLDQKYSIDGDDGFDAVFGTPSEVIMSKSDAFYFSLGYLAATVKHGYIRAIIPHWDFSSAAEHWFQRNFPGAPFTVKQVERSGDWDSMYGMRFELKIPAIAGKLAPTFLTTDLKGSSLGAEKFQHVEWQSKAGAIVTSGTFCGRLINIRFIIRLINDYGFNFGEGDAAAPTLQKLLYYVPDEKANIVKQGYMRGESVLKLHHKRGVNVDEVEVNAVDLENPFKQDFPPIDN